VRVLVVPQPLAGDPQLAATGRSKSWLVNEALRSYVANEQQFLAAVEEGKQALQDGKIVDHETVVAAFERIVKPQP
jgi:predicted transcriptional regulator